MLMQALAPRGEAAPRVAGLEADYQLRFFAPGLGIDEDPVTGSAHALVAPFWMDALRRPRVVGWQCSDRPGGMVCEAGSSGMIRLIGSGHLLWEGTLRDEPEHGCAPSAPGAAMKLERNTRRGAAVGGRAKTKRQQCPPETGTPTRRPPLKPPPPR